MVSIYYNMYKPRFNKRQVLVFRQFGNKGYSLFSCLGREVVCSVLSVATLTYASAESVSTRPVVTDSTTTTTAREMLLEEVSVTGSRAPLTKSQAARMVTVLERTDIAQAPVQSINDLLKYAVGVDVRQRGPIGAQTDISITLMSVSEALLVPRLTSPSEAVPANKSSSYSTALISVTLRRVIT